MSCDTLAIRDPFVSGAAAYFLNAGIAFVMPLFTRQLPTNAYPVRTDGNPPKGTALSTLFLATPGQIRTDRVTPRGALAGRFLVCRSFALIPSRLLPHRSDFPTDATLLTWAWLPHLLPQNLAARGNATALLLSRHHRYSLTTTGYIGPV